jgi:hypothetical protein
MRLTVDLPLSWGDLYNFVDAARAAGIPADRAVEEVTASQDESLIIGLAVDLPGLDGRVVTLAHDERVEFADALSRVVSSQGDARGVLDEIQGLRDRLLGA